MFKKQTKHRNPWHRLISVDMTYYMLSDLIEISFQRKNCNDRRSEVEKPTLLLAYFLMRFFLDI